jgi:hypothetical protein
MILIEHEKVRNNYDDGLNELTRESVQKQTEIDNLKKTIQSIVSAQKLDLKTRFKEKEKVNELNVVASEKQAKIDELEKKIEKLKSINVNDVPENFMSTKIRSMILNKLVQNQSNPTQYQQQHKPNLTKVKKINNKNKSVKKTYFNRNMILRTNTAPQNSHFLQLKPSQKPKKNYTISKTTK